jgi:hypothetical protein
LHQFNEHHPEFKGFSDYFEKEIAPFLSAREGERAEKLSKAKFLGACIVAVGLGVLIFSKVFDWGDDPYIFIIMACAAALFGMYHFLFKDVSKFTKQQIVGGICHYVGWTFVAKPETQPSLVAWTRLFLIPAGYEKDRLMNSRTVRFEDQIFGKAHGADFAIDGPLHLYHSRSSCKSWSIWRPRWTEKIFALPSLTPSFLSRLKRETDMRLDR